MSNPTEASLQKLLDAQAPCRLAGAYDAVTCGLAEEAGFDAIWASGLCIAAARGLPDTDLISYDAFLASLKVLRDATKLPILADCNTGFGDLHTVAHVARELALMGVDGICLEDKRQPRGNSLIDSGDQGLETQARFATKLRSAAKGRGAAPLTIVARIESLIVGEGIERALERAHVYRQAGADALVVHSSAATADEVLEFASRWEEPTPVLVVPTTFPDLSMEVAGAHGIAGVIYANQALRVAIEALRSFFAEAVTADRLSDCRTPLSPIGDIFSLQHMDRYAGDCETFQAWERLYDESQHELPRSTVANRAE